MGAGGDGVTPLEALRMLVKRDDFRWRHGYMGAIHCASCGAAARMNDYGVILPTEPCSQSCPWRQAEEVIALEDAESCGEP